MGKVVADYRLSWSCMQLAYVSTGSFISLSGRSLSGAFPRSYRRSRGGQGKRPIAAAMPEEEDIIVNNMMMCIYFRGIFFFKRMSKD